MSLTVLELVFNQLALIML